MSYEISSASDIQGQFQNDLGFNATTQKIEQGFPLTRDTETDLATFDRIYTGERGETRINEYGNTEITMTGAGAGLGSEGFRVTQNDTVNQERAMTIIQNSADYALKIDGLNTGDYDIVNIVSKAENGTAVGVNGENLTLSTMKVTNTAPSTTGAVISAWGDNPNRESEVISVLNRGKGPAFLADMKSTTTGRALYIRYDPASTYNEEVIDVDSNNVTNETMNLTNTAAQTADNMVLFNMANAGSTADVLKINNFGTGNGIFIQQMNDAGNSQSTGGALLVNNTQNTGIGINNFTDATTATAPLTKIMANQATFNQPTLQIDQNGTGDAILLRKTSTARFRLSSDGVMWFDRTFTSGATTGDQTINKPAGTVNMPIGGTSLVVTNSLVTAQSFVYAICRTNDATCQVKNVTVAAGSFTINTTAATAQTIISFLVVNF